MIRKSDVLQAIAQELAVKYGQDVKTKLTPHYQDMYLELYGFTVGAREMEDSSGGRNSYWISCKDSKGNIVESCGFSHLTEKEDLPGVAKSIAYGMIIEIDNALNAAKW